ncbi:MAG: RIP metalloprotease [Desulfuromonadaceae bacterium]
MRQGQALQLTIRPDRDEANGREFIIGIAPLQESEFRRFGFFEALRAGADRTAELIELTLVFVQKLVAGHVSSKSIGGPITVVQIAGQAAQTSLSSILTVLAFLSIQLGILNLLPIPILDGGHLFFNLYEAVFRRPLSLRAREIAQQVGLLVIISLMVLAFYNDIVRIFFGAQ